MATPLNKAFLEAALLLQAFIAGVETIPLGRLSWFHGHTIHYV